MKILICSDIHGNAESFQKVFNFFNQEMIDQMIILGDTFSSGFFKSVRDEEISKMLWKIYDKVILVEGNCDGSLARELSPVGVVKKYNGLINGKTFLCYHGHIPYHLQESSSMYIQGHTHIVKLVKDQDGTFYLNPGSVGRPRDYTIGSFMVITKEAITIYDLNYQVLQEEYF